MAKVIMIQGTMSGAGKSLICAGLLRIFKQDGYKVAPFKSQNMALNSYITNEGLEIGRAQAMQAEAASIEPSVNMNPILLKPVTNMGSQVIVLGKPIGNMKAAEYYKYKIKLAEKVKTAFNNLANTVDIIVIEGAGSPAELNLKANDFVNMGMAEMAKSPVILVGDIDRGGVFAQLYGTVMLLDDKEKDYIKGLLVNKFRGDIGLFEDGIKIIEEKTKKDVLGVMPMIDVDIDDEDSFSHRLTSEFAKSKIDIAVIYLDKISNFSDFTALSAIEGVTVRYVKKVDELEKPDMIIIPGTKNTISDLKKIRESGIETKIKQLASEGTLVIGICGGYQMLGKSILDEDNVECGGSIEGMDLLPVITSFRNTKNTKKQEGIINIASGIFENLDGYKVSGYEIHMGESKLVEDAVPFITFMDNEQDGCINGNIMGTYLHGFFDETDIREGIIGILCKKKGIEKLDSIYDYRAYREKQYDILADELRKNIDMKKIYKILNEGI